MESDGIKIYDRVIEIKQGDLTKQSNSYEAVVNSIGTDYGFGGQIAKALGKVMGMVILHNCLESSKGS